VTGTAIEAAARPHWVHTGYKFFPYAAQQSGHWWVLRLNHGFPEHDMYTVFIDGTAAADLTADAANPSPLVAMPPPPSLHWTPRRPPPSCRASRPTSTTAANTTTRACSALRTTTR
jgi:hypothetical protein